jgi:hypothetical protein
MDEEHQAHHKSLFPLVRGVIYLFSAKNLEEIGQLASDGRILGFGLISARQNSPHTFRAS